MQAIAFARHPRKQPWPNQKGFHQHLHALRTMLSLFERFTDSGVDALQLPPGILLQSVAALFWETISETTLQAQIPDIHRTPQGQAYAHQQWVG